MAEQVKSPEPGQYWEHVKSKDRAYFIGRDPDGVMVWQCEGDIIEVGNLDWSDWQHIPGCTGWEWEPETWPKYYVLDPTTVSPYDKDIVYARFDGARKGETFCCDGSSHCWTVLFDPQGWVEVTEAEAKARFTPKPEPCAMCGGQPINGTAGCKDCTEYAVDAVKAPAEEFPQYWTTICGPSSSIAYIKRIDEKTIVSVKKDGTEVPDNVLEWNLKLRKRLTKEEAAALLTPEAETFPQWYILKEDERRSWVPDWIIKRTGEETSIRYARDEAGELYATEEPWCGAAGCWERCSAEEAFGRLGTAMLPEVAPAKKRFPIDLWVTYRVHDERGDWPVRATPAGETCQNWKRIQFGSNGAFIEVE